MTKLDFIDYQLVITTKKDYLKHLNIKPIESWVYYALKTADDPEIQTEQDLINFQMDYEPKDDEMIQVEVDNKLYFMTFDDFGKLMKFLRKGVLNE